MKRIFARFLIAAFTLIAGLWLAGTILSWPARKTIGAPPADLAKAEAVTFASTSGATLKGWYVPGQPRAGAIVLLHGVRGNRLEVLGRARMLAHAGYSVLLIDQQAHGESTGQQISFGYLESRDARAAVDYLRLRCPPERIGIIGVSLGGAATILAEPPIQADAVVLEMVYPDIHRALANRVGRYLGSWARGTIAPLLEWQLKPRLGIDANALRPIDHVGALTMPKLFIAGQFDRHTPLNESQELFNAAAAPKELWVVPDAQHEDLHAKAKAEYEQRVASFFAKNLR